MVAKSNKSGQSRNPIGPEKRYDVSEELPIAAAKEMTASLLFTRNVWIPTVATFARTWADPATYPTLWWAW